MGRLNLVGGDNEKLKTKCEYTNAKKAVATGNKLFAFTRNVGCLGLSANQVGIMERVCIAKINNKFKIFINPHIIKSWGKQVSEKEGCLSFPGVRGDIVRPQNIMVMWITINNGIEISHEEVFTGMDAIVLEHEIDHLNGIRCIDKMKK